METELYIFDVLVPLNAKMRDSGDTQLPRTQWAEEITSIIQANILQAYELRRDYTTLEAALWGYYGNALATMKEQGFPLYEAALILARRWPVELKAFRAERKGRSR